MIELIGDRPHGFSKNLTNYISEMKRLKDAREINSITEENTINVEVADNK